MIDTRAQRVLPVFRAQWDSRRSQRLPGRVCRPQAVVPTGSVLMTGSSFPHPCRQSPWDYHRWPSAGRFSSHPDDRGGIQSQGVAPPKPRPPSTAGTRRRCVGDHVPFYIAARSPMPYVAAGHSGFRRCRPAGAPRVALGDIDADLTWRASDGNAAASYTSSPPGRHASAPSSTLTCFLPAAMAQH